MTPDFDSGRSFADAARLAMRRRGPDTSGDFSGARWRVGMNRLRIWGADAALPFEVEGSRFAFNGEIYGSLDTALRQGARNRAGGAGEMQFWAGAEDRMIDGMYAVIALRERTGELYVERDRFGIKPCYYATPAPGTVLIGSDSEFLARYVRAGTSREAICESFVLGFPLPGKSLFDRVAEVPAGTRITWTESGAAHASTRRGLPERFDSAAELRALVTEAVARCATCDAVLGLAVSGGMDSTILAHTLNELNVENVHTFSVINGADGILDLRQIGLDGPGACTTWTHHAVDFAALDLPGMFAAAVASYPFPTNMSSIVLYEALARDVEAAGLRVLMVGEGVDEIFLGYDQYLPVTARTSPRAYYLGARAPWLERIFGRAAIDAVFQHAAAIYGEEDGLDAIRRIEVRSRLEKLLHRTDVITMAHSIEARTPFLHRGIPERALTEPAERVRGAGGKQLLRDAFPEVTEALRGSAKRRFKLDEKTLAELFCADEFAELYYSGSLLPGGEKDRLLQLFQATGDSKTAELILSLATAEACSAKNT